MTHYMCSESQTGERDPFRDIFSLMELTGVTGVNDCISGNKTLSIQHTEISLYF